MSARHPEFVHLVEGLAAGDRLTDGRRRVLESYAAPVNTRGRDEDTLDRVTREAVEKLTGDDNVGTPSLAARALLAA